jgi:hypothetical protein
LPELSLVVVGVGNGSPARPGGVPGAGVPGGACASVTEGAMTATMTVRSTITTNTVRLQDGNVMGLPSIHMVNTG